MTNSPSNVEEQKQHAARRSLEFVEDGMLIGLGSGTTAAYLIRALGEQVRHTGLRVTAIPTSMQTRDIALEQGITIVAFEHRTRIDVTIDGADEIDPQLQLIKGHGGALLHEKIVAAASNKVVIIADKSKLVPTLGASPVPVEVITFGWQIVAERVRVLGGEPTLRISSSGAPFLTEEGNYILDCHFSARITEPAVLAAHLDRITGVVEHGIFIGLADIAVIGETPGAIVIKKDSAATSLPHT